MRARLRTVWRSIRLIVHLLVGLAAATAVRLDFTDHLRAEPIAQRWSRRLLQILGIGVRVHGRPVSGAHVITANHVSWLDIPLLASCGSTRFIAKSEIRDWPVAGWLANAAGTFYIRRGRGGARTVAERLVPHLAAGGGVVLFPEGTTTDGRQLMPFHARLFGAAIDADAAVQPVALRYGSDAAGGNVAPFVGDDDLVSHIRRLLRCTGLQAEVIFCPPVSIAHSDRDALAAAAQQAVGDALGLSSTAAAAAPVQRTRTASLAA